MRGVDDQRPARVPVAVQAGELERELALARARRAADDRDRSGVQHAGQLGQLGLAADEREPARGHVAVEARGRRRLRFGSQRQRLEADGAVVGDRDEPIREQRRGGLDRAAVHLRQQDGLVARGIPQPHDAIGAAGHEPAVGRVREPEDRGGVPRARVAFAARQLPDDDRAVDRAGAHAASVGGDCERLDAPRVRQGALHQRAGREVPGRDRAVGAACEQEIGSRHDGERLRRLRRSERRRDAARREIEDRDAREGVLSGRRHARAAGQDAQRGHGTLHPGEPAGTRAGEIPDDDRPVVSGGDDATPVLE